jgi:membrane-bound lytic murein transglycosylase A
MYRFLPLAAALILAGCASRVVPPSRPPVVAPRPPVVTRPVVPPTVVVPRPPSRPSAERALLPSVPARGGSRAADAGLRPGPTVANLALSPATAARALEAFRLSCPSVTRRADRTGLTRPTDWADACAAARGWSNRDAVRFFSAHFESVEVGDGAAFATGYYEATIRGCRTPQPGCEVPIYRVPPNFRKPYLTRAQIMDGALAAQGLEIAWAADPIDLFFMEIQGSGRLTLPDGGVMRLGYAEQNGRGYVAIGRILRERGELQPGNITLQTIQAWMRRQPDGGRALMRENPSYIFFRELTGAGPIGSLGVPVTPRGSVAVDPSFVTYGAPVLLSGMDNPNADGLWVAQDTGGAIRGANRFDTFWGAGAEAVAISGPLQTRGRALLFLPRGTLERLSGNAPAQR